MNKIIASAAVAAALTVGLVPGAEAAAARLHLNSSAAHSINAYSDAHCSSGRQVIKKGDSATGRRSYRVNAVSYVKRAGGDYHYVARNACRSLSAGVTYYVNVRP